jgi:flagellar biosynthetic protein FlhB
MFRLFLEHPDRMSVTGPGLMSLMTSTVMQAGTLLALPILLIMGVALSGHVLQARPHFSGDKIKPDFSKISPLKGLKRMFGLDGVMNLLKGLFKIGIVGIALWSVLWPERNRLEAILSEPAGMVANDMISLLFKIFFATLAVLAVMAAADYAFERFRFMKRNRMTKQEIKDEIKQSEGDPHIKAKIRQIRIEKSRQRMMAAVPEATVVIMNPTHFAVALKYESGKMAAPVCVAKGVDALALRIRKVAEENDVPVVENPPLARALYATVDVDEPVPPEQYKAVAQVIGYVMRLSGQLRAN